MYFDLTDEQKSLNQTLEKFFEARFGVAEGVKAIEETALDRKLWADICELGLGGVLVPEAQGGLGLGLLTLSVIAEVLGTYAVPAPVLPNALAAWVLAASGSDSQKEKWMDPLVRGEKVAAFAVAEGESWFHSALSVTDGVLSGAKNYVERGDEADVFIVTLADGKIALVDAPGNGVSATPLETLDRTRPLCDVVFDRAQAEHLDGDNLLIGRLLDAILILLSADALGAARGAQARAVAYAKERKQFGQLIGSFQGLKHQLADVSVELEPSRPLYWYVAHAWDTGREDSRRMAALVKAHIGEIAVDATRVAIEAHGGIGYTWEYPIHLFLKRAMFDKAAFGTPGVHRERAAKLSDW